MLLPSALGFSPHPPVSVYGTGIANTIAAFLGTSSSCFATYFRSISLHWIVWRICLPYSCLAYTGFSNHTLTWLTPRFPFAVVPYACVPTFLSYCGTGISTRCPSDTPFGLSLGPDLPRADQLYPGNLGYSAVRILTLLSLLIPAFSLPICPLPRSVQLRPYGNAPLPTHH